MKSECQLIKNREGLFITDSGNGSGLERRVIDSSDDSRVFVLKY